MEQGLQEELWRNPLMGNVVLSVGQPTAKCFRNGDALERAKIGNIVMRESKIQAHNGPLQGQMREHSSLLDPIQGQQACSLRAVIWRLCFNSRHSGCHYLCY